MHLPKRKTSIVAASIAVLVGTGALAGTATSFWWDMGSTPKLNQVRPALTAGQATPSIANGVAVGATVPLYYSSGTGPSGANTSAPGGTPERFIDTATLPGGALGPGVTITEAQALNVLKRIEENLAAQKMTPAHVISMRVFLDNPPGSDVADYAGWNRAYRQWYANTNLTTGEVLNVPFGSAAPAPPLFVNRARPSRTTIEVGSLPVAGWLVEIEVVAAFPKR
ncbi:MAG: hypothetical protein JHC84_19945 [Solirubrobacteraceae bacterium]|nr:hypothetical protein [Solirubrobacteraceae bacterium]